MDFINSFNGGLSQDLDPQQRSPNSYEQSHNGRIIFNPQGNYIYENSRGNRYYFSIPTGYSPIGSVEFPEFLCIISTNNNFTEFGLLTIDENEIPTYTTIFNDQYDFNGEKLGLTKDHLITKAWGVIESPTKMRIYATDNNVDPFTFNVVAGIQANNSDFEWGNYQPNPTTLKYPWWYSVHSSSLYADFRMGRIKFAGKGDPFASPVTGGGSLKVGVFQYFYQLETREGYFTPPTPLTRHIFLTSVDINDITSSHDYFMDASNIATPYSILLQLTGIDARYWKLRVGYVYTIAEKVTVESNIFHEELLDGTTTTINVEHKQHSGTPFNMNDLNAYPVAIIRALDIEEKDQRLWFGNVGTIGDLSIDTSTIEIAPHPRDLFDGDVLGIETSTPLTDVITKNLTKTIQSYVDTNGNPVYESYTIVNDFETYAGMQTEHLFQGHWRGETYPYGIMLRDRKGIPFYVQQIEDYTFPQQYDDATYKLTHNTVSVTIMGVKFSNIRIPNTVLYDRFGNIQVSSFEIVRCKRKPRILFQGILLDTLYARDAGGDPDEKDITRPLAFATEDFSAAFQGTDSQKWDSDTYDFDDAGHEYGNRPFTQIMHSPELSFGFDVYAQTGQTGLNKETDYLQFVGLCAGIYSNVSICGTTPEIILLDGSHHSYYSKHYSTVIDDCHYDIGAISRMAAIAKPIIGEQVDGYDPDDLDLSFLNKAQLKFACDNLYFALGCPNSWVIKTKDWKILEPGSISSPTEDDRYCIVNYCAPSSNYYSEPNEKRLYISTGHIQPINADVIADVKKYYNDDSPAEELGLQFDDVEVYGGDCIVNLWDFVRIYPFYDFDITEIDYSLGHVVPLESNLNTWLRRGRSLAKSGIEPNATSNGNATVFKDGVSQNQPEAFDLNNVLLHQENIQFFPSLPDDIDITQKDFPNRWVYTEIKFYGELQDNYRKVLSNNYADVIGIYGDISGGLLWRNEIYSFQKKGWGRLRINDRAIIPNELGEAAQTGAGDTYSGILYFSHLYGTQHIHTLFATEAAMYWIDVNNRAICKYNSEGQQILSDTKGLHGFANSVLPFFDTPEISQDGTKYNHLRTIYDLKNNEIIFIYADNLRSRLAVPSGALIYNENTDAFTDMPEWTSVWAAKYRNIYLASNLDFQSKIYLGNSGDYCKYFDGDHKDTVITMTVNPLVGVSKKFDNCFTNINEDGALMLDKVEMVTEEQSMSISTFQTFIKKIYRFNNLIFTLWDQTSAERVQGKAMRLTFRFKNDGVKNLKMTSNKTTVRATPNPSLPPRK